MNAWEKLQSIAGKKKVASSTEAKPLIPCADPWQRFKIELAKMIIVSTILYGVAISFAFLMWGAAAAQDQLLWQFLTTTVSTMMGWLMSKASTIIDHQFGTSSASDQKTQFIMNEVKSKKEEPVG